MAIMVKFLTIKRISIWANGYDMHSAMDGEHIRGTIEHVSLALKFNAVLHQQPKHDIV